MMLEPYLEVVVENVITVQTTWKIVTYYPVNLTAHSNMVFCAFFNNHLQ